MLPDVRLGVDYAHVRLIGAAEDEQAIVEEEARVARVVWRVDGRDGALDERDAEELLVDDCAVSGAEETRAHSCP